MCIRDSGRAGLAPVGRDVFEHAAAAGGIEACGVICFQKRGRYMAGFSYLLNPKAVEDGYLAIVLPNMVDIPKSNCMLNLFEAHIKSDTVDVYKRQVRARPRLCTSLRD